MALECVYNVIIYPDMASNHRFCKSDIKPAINHSDTNYNTHLVQTEDETLSTRSYYVVLVNYN